MIAALLYRSGLYLGARKELLPPGPDNEDGYWENLRFVALNEELLRAAGGGWDEPPKVFDPHKPEARAVRIKATAIGREFDLRSPWAWKDPRNTVTLPFWLDLFPQLQVVACVRNPLEVALSLHRRNDFSYERGLALWLDYNRRLLDDAPHGQLVLTHYDSYFADPLAELARILGRCGLTATALKLEKACSVVRPSLHHNRFSASDLVAANVSPDIIDLYRRLCEACEWSSDDVAARASNGSRRHNRPTLNRGVLDAGLRLRQVKRTVAMDGHRTAGGTRAIPEEARESTIRKVRGDLESAQIKLRDREEQLTQLSQAVAAAARQQSLERVELRAELQELSERVEEYESLQPGDSSAAIARRRASEPFRETVMAVVPPGAVVFVASSGDEALLNLRSRRAQHFPQDGFGKYSGVLPASSLAAIARLEAVRYRAFDSPYFAIPREQFWWLDRYEQFARHLNRRYVPIHHSENAIVYHLAGGSQSGSIWHAHLEDLVQVFSAAYDREPAVLDWGSGLDVGAHFPEIAVFSPSGGIESNLPYLDATIDVVVIPAGDDAALAEARRVASVAIAQASQGSLDVEWRVAIRSLLPSVSIVIPSYNGIEFTEACVRSLIDTVPAWLDAEFVVVDDCSTDETQDRLAVLARTERRLRVLRNEVNSGFLMTCNRGAFEARGEIVLWLNNDTLALPGWLPPLMRMFRERPDVVGVGGKLIFPDGRLQEAGGVVFSDGRAANLGKWYPDPSDPLFDYVREVDYVSGAHLAFRRSFLEQVGGFDERYRPIYCEDTDICFKARELGLRVLYQPESAIIHIEGGTSGTDESKGDKRYQVLNREVFTTRWADALRRQPTYPNRFDLSTLHRLAVRGQT
jgi:GT2 family glycosyltransferase